MEIQNRQAQLSYRVAILRIAVGICTGSICFADLAYALNGSTGVGLCSCKTTTDFTNAAFTISSLGDDQYLPGTFTLASSIGTSTAQIKIIASSGRNGSKSYNAYPVNSTGTVLSGEAETTLEAYYAAYDQQLFGANRSNPTAVTEPDEYSGSFINSDDSEVVPGIGYALIQMGINQGQIPAGTLITVNFSDGTSAQYIKASATATYQWTWNGIAYTSKANGHHLMLRNGSLVTNPNTAGTGGGSITAPGFGNDWTWLVNNQNYCSLSVTVDFGDGPVEVGGGYVPC